MQEKKIKSFTIKENKFKSIEAERFINAVQELINSRKARSFTEVAEKAGFKSQDFVDMKSAKKDLQKDFLDAVAAIYLIDKNFILTGERTGNFEELNSLDPNGRTIVTPRGKIVTQTTNKRKTSELIPFYNADFMAGGSEMFYEDATIYPEYFMDVPEFYGCTAFRAYSDSMETKIRSGNILFGMKVPDWRIHLDLGGIYGITTTDGRRYLKYIRAHPDKRYFMLRSENPNYDEFEIPKSKIKNIWQIEGWLDKRN